MVAMTRFVLRHKSAVVVFWLVVLVAGGAASAKLSSRLSPSFALPGAAGYQANQQVLRLYGNGGSGYPEVAVVRLPPGQDAASPATRQALGRAYTAVTAQVSGVRVADYASTGDRAFLGRGGRVTYGLVFTPYTGELSPPSLGPQVAAAMTPRLPPGSAVAVTGMSELQSGGQAKEGFGVLAETLLAGAAALAVLALVFGSALALVPLLMAAVAIPACFLAIYGLAEVTSVSVIVQYLAALIGLGVAIDYSLLLVTREVLVPASANPAALAVRLAALPGVRAAVAPAGPTWRRDGTALVSVQSAAEPSTPAGAATLARVRNAVASIPGALAGGPGALLLDENHAFYGRFPLLVAVLAVVTVLLLAKPFGSLLIPLKAVALNLASVGATYGVIALIWQHGYGSQAIWGLPATGAITNWVPLIAFAFLYGLSMDYEVFILTRIREERDRTCSTTTAVTEGIGRTGRLVTGAALILFLAFAALSTGPETDLKVRQ
jgi:RND superfamily putative drug exporter